MEEASATPQPTPTSDDDHASEPESGGKGRAFILVTVVLLLGGGAIGFARGAYEVLGITPNRWVGAMLGLATLVAGLLLAAFDLRERYGKSKLAASAVWLMPALGAGCFILVTLLRDPLAPLPLEQMQGRTNVALVDFVPGDVEEVSSPAGRNLVAIVAGGIDELEGQEGLDVRSYHPSDAIPLAGDRDGDDLEQWIDDFVRQTDAHLVVSGMYQELSNSDHDDPESRTASAVESQIDLVFYIRPDAIPDAPELSRWYEATSVVTLADVTGTRFARSDEELLADELGSAVTALTEFIEATDSMRAGRPREAARQLEMLVEGPNAQTLPAEFIDLYLASALALSADLEEGQARIELLEEAKLLLQDYADEDRFLRARFLLAEIDFQEIIAHGAGCTARIDLRRLDDVTETFQRLSELALDYVTKAKAMLGALEGSSCRVLATSFDAGSWASVRSEGHAIVELLDGLPEPERTAGEPIMARALAIWPELVMKVPTSGLSEQASNEFRRALDLERRPERRMNIWLGLAVLSAHRCLDQEVAEPLRRAAGMADLGIEQERLDRERADDLMRQIEEYVNSYLSEHCG